MSACSHQGSRDVKAVSNTSGCDDSDGTFRSPSPPLALFHSVWIYSQSVVFRCWGWVGAVLVLGTPFRLNTSIYFFSKYHSKVGATYCRKFLVFIFKPSSEVSCFLHNSRNYSASPCFRNKNCIV